MQDLQLKTQRFHNSTTILEKYIHLEYSQKKHYYKHKFLSSTNDNKIINIGLLLILLLMKNLLALEDI